MEDDMIHQKTWKYQNWDFDRIFLSKVENAWAKYLQRSYCNDPDEWWKIWRKIDLSFQNWHEEFNEFWPEH